ncbi:MAG: outer membrane protein assembly factor BamA [Nitrospirae bacterium]|nr:outer membrane protein assembly factor BamA [Nitrospirota bacterium]
MLFLFLISHCSLLIAAYASNSEWIIKAIDVEGAMRIKPEELIDIVGLSVGDAIDKDTLKNGIKRAFKKDLFIDIKAVAEPFQVGSDSTRDGVKLKYIVKEIPLVNRIHIKGNKFISERKIKGILIFKAGEDFREEFLENAKSAIIGFYVKKGFPDINVKIDVDKDKSPYKVNFYIKIEEGSPLIIKALTVPEKVKDLIKIREGDIFDIEEIDKEINRIKEYYKGHGYIKPLIGPYEFTEGELKIPVMAGQRLEVNFKGNTVFSSKRLLKEIAFIKDEEITDELIEDTINRIKRLYYQEGYNHVQIAGGIETEDTITTVDFFIFEGKRVILRGIEFSGITISPQTMESIIPFKKHKPFDEGLMEGSKESIVGFYNGLGYLSAEVKDIKKDFIKDGRELNLIFTIHEGPQIRIEEINIIGNHSVSEDEIRKAIMLNESTPYNAIDIGDARYRVLSLYNRLGYADTHVEMDSLIKDSSAFITFNITEGSPSYIGKIIIRGNRKTKEKIIRREFEFKEGELYNQEKILKTKQRLYRLGLFTEVSIEPIRTTETEIDKFHVKDILVSLNEGNAGAIEIGIGYGDYERLRGFFDITYRNIGGYNRQIGLRTELSSIEKRHILSFKEPWFLNKPMLPLSLYFTREDKKSINIDTRETIYKIDRTSLLAGIDKELTHRLRANLSYEYSIVDTEDVKPGVILSKEDTGSLVIGSISPSIFYDTRDNPFNPTTGSIKGLTLKLASKAFLSDTEFIKMIVHGAWFFKIQKGIIFAFSLRGGASYGTGETTELPLIERFFLGGRTTVRGYNQDTLGPKSADNIPTGGNAFALTNAELRLSLWKGFGVVTFLDGGNVWKDTNDINLTLKYTTGAGLRYDTPVGPLRIDYGHKLNKEGGESAGELHFSLGHAF